MAILKGSDTFIPHRCAAVARHLDRWCRWVQCLGMSLSLYHSVESTCAQKVRLVMAEKRLKWEETRLNLRKGEQFDPIYLKLNPKAVVPTLVHDGCVIKESSVINEYLEDSFPEPSLRPANACDRARMRLLVKMVDDEVHPSIGILSYAVFLRHQMNELKTPEELAGHFQKVADPMRRERQMRTHEDGLASPAAALAVQNLARVIRQLDEVLLDGPWLAGESYSLADAAAAPYMIRTRALRLGGLWEDKPRVAAWLANAEAHAAALDLTEPWGSESLAALVARHVQNEKTTIRALLAEEAACESSI